MNSFIIHSVTVLLYSVTAIECFAQPDWQFLRQETGFNDAIADASGHVSAAVGIEPEDHDYQGGNILSVAEVAVSATAAGPSFAQTQVLSQAMNLTPIGSTTHVPTVDTTLSRSDIASATDITTDSVIQSSGTGGPHDAGTLAHANGKFNLEGSVVSGFLQGSIYLFGHVTSSTTDNATYFTAPLISASIDNYQVNAGYNPDTELWMVEVVRYPTTFGQSRNFRY